MSRYSKQIVNQNDPNSLYTKVIKLVGKEKKVIDFGCSSGYLDKVLRNEFDCKVWGVEFDPSDARRAERYCEKVLNCDLENYNWQEELRKDAPFDVAVFADVLEHLKDPVNVLKQTKPLLKPNGYIIVSIPNIAHSSVRLELLLGNFEYEKLGILDSTHLHFYTKNTAAEMIEKGGFYIEVIDSTSTDLVNSLIREYFARLGTRFTRKTKELFEKDEARIIQYIFKATANPGKRYRGWTRSKFVKPLDLNSLKAKRADEEIDRLKIELRGNRKTLETIYGSRSWKLVARLGKLKKSIPLIKKL